MKKKIGSLLCSCLILTIFFSNIAFAVDVAETMETPLGTTNSSIALPSTWVQMELTDNMNETGTLLMASNESNSIMLQVSVNHNIGDTMDNVLALLQSIENITTLQKTLLGERTFIIYELQNVACYITALADGSIVTMNFTCLNEAEMPAAREQSLAIAESFNELTSTKLK